MFLGLSSGRRDHSSNGIKVEGRTGCFCLIDRVSLDSTRMKLSVAFLVHFLAFAYAVPTAVISVSSSTSTSSSSPIAFLPAAKQVVEIDIFRNANFNRSFPLVYFRSIQRVVKRHEIIGLHDENYRLAKRQTYGFGTAVERYAFGPAVERRILPSCSVN